MTIKKIVLSLQRKIRTHGQYAHIAFSTGVSLRWVTKFATSTDPNPTFKVLQKLETFFLKIEKDKIKKETV